MFSLTFLFGMLGNIMAGLVYISPSNVFWQIVKRRSTEEYESIPYVCKLLNAFFWIYYGLIKPNSFLIATINIFGAAVEITFLILFLTFAPPNMRTRTAILVAALNMAFPAAAILIIHFRLRGDMRIDTAGLFCAGFSIIACASPLSAMKTVILTKSVEYMPFLLSFILFINGGVWTVYAVLVQDLFVAVPNVIGLLLGAAQLALYAMYWKPKKYSKQIYDDLVDKQKHEPLLSDSKHLDYKVESIYVV